MSRKDDLERYANQFNLNNYEFFSERKFIYDDFDDDEVYGDADLDYDDDYDDESEENEEWFSDFE